MGPPPPQLIECIDSCVLSLVRSSELRGSGVYLRVVNKIILIFFFKFSQYTCPWMAFAGNFFGISLCVCVGGGGGLRGKSFIGNIWYFGTHIFPVVVRDYLQSTLNFKKKKKWNE